MYKLEKGQHGIYNRYIDRIRNVLKKTRAANNANTNTLNVQSFKQFLVLKQL
jgi:hypothetical protein